MTRQRLFIRLCSFFAFLLLAEIFARHTVKTFPAQNFNFSYRFPPGQESIYMPILVTHIRDIRTTNPSGKIIVFSGSSPTYGRKIKNSDNTYPEAFLKNLLSQPKQAQDKNIAPIQVYNTASDGQLVSDQYYIVRSLIHDADMFYIQLNYHTFNPEPLLEVGIRHKEMPEKLGVKVTDGEAAILNRRPTPVLPLNVPLQNVLKKISKLYLERETLPLLLFGGKPEDKLYDAYAKWMVIRAQTSQDALLTQAAPFSQLPPQKQMIIVKRFSERCHFNLRGTASNSELFFLKRTARLLKKYKKPAVFFITPLNRDALDAYEVMDWKKYNENARVLSDIARASGFLFLDMNKQHRYSDELFFDISHTLDAGGKIVGRDLFNDTKTYLEKAL